MWDLTFYDWELECLMILYFWMCHFEGYFNIYSNVLVGKDNINGVVENKLLKFNKLCNFFLESLMKVHSTLHQDRHGGGTFSPKEFGGLGNSRSFFTYEELFKATNAFSAQNLLGEGGFGSVYKGYLPDGREVAVKELKIGGGQGEQEFKAEVEIIGRVHHRHLVSLVGYCISEHQRLLVYDYVSNNSLYYHLHVKGIIDFRSFDLSQY